MNKIELVLQESEKAFDAECEREDRLTTKAETYIGAVVIIIGFKIIDLESLKLANYLTHPFLSWLSAISFLFFGISLVYALISRRVWNYLSYPRGERLIHELRPNNIDDDSAKIMIAKMYLAARENNAVINDQRAGMLSISGILMVVGFIVAVLSAIATKLF